MRPNPVYGKSLLIVWGHKIHFQKNPYMGNVEEIEYVNCCVSFAFKYISGNLVATFREIAANSACNMPPCIST